MTRRSVLIHLCAPAAEPHAHLSTDLGCGRGLAVGVTHPWLGAVPCACRVWALVGLCHLDAGEKEILTDGISGRAESWPAKAANDHPAR